MQTYLVNLLVRARGTESVKTKLLMRVLLPAECGHDLDAHGGDTVGDDREPVVLLLSIEHLDARHGHNTGLEALVLERLDGLQA